MTISSAEECTTPVPKCPPPLPCDPTSDRPFGLEFDPEELKDFLRANTVDWNRPLFRNYDVLATVHRIFEEEVQSGRCPPEALPSIKRTIEKVGGLTGAIMYEYIPFELKVQIGVFSTLAVEIDDLCEKQRETMIPAIARFLGTWVGKDPVPQHYYLEHIMRNVTVDLRKWFGPITTGNLIHATISFLEGCLIEVAYPLGVVCPPTASRFPLYLRTKSGLSECYAHFAFPNTMFPEKEYFETYFPSITDMTEWINRVNDLLSFYKESVAGPDQETHLMTTAKLLGQNPVDVWRDFVKKALQLADEITQSLSRKEEVKKAWLSYIEGYCRFHFTQPRRYRLDEIGIIH